ncbi:MAG: patatin family protein [Erysipelotrichaceae bacterium]|nr:patatin family protein [Erysipelotrichaceae bacterium]
MSKVGLVLEGGGMRGAYTAGALSWFLDNNIEFDYSVGISSGAVHVCSFLLKNQTYLHDISVEYMTDKNYVGIRAFLTEGRLVAYSRIFDKVLYKEIGYDVKPLINSDLNFEMGIYDCEKGEALFKGKEYLDEKLQFLKATCSLPIAGKIVNYRGHKYLDGGIRYMIPIERSIEVGCDKYFVISTKHKGYVRKAAGWFMRTFMKLNFLKYPKLADDYNIRHKRYYEQVDIVEDLEKQGKAYFLRPSIIIPVKRFSGDKENLEKMYQLGIEDMENNKEEILKFLER